MECPFEFAEMEIDDNTAFVSFKQPIGGLESDFNRNHARKFRRFKIPQADLIKSIKVIKEMPKSRLENDIKKSNDSIQLHQKTLEGLYGSYFVSLREASRGLKCFICGLEIERELMYTICIPDEEEPKFLNFHSNCLPEMVDLEEFIWNNYGKNTLKAIYS